MGGFQSVAVMVGRASGGSFTDCYASGIITPANTGANGGVDVGGFCGHARTSVVLTRCGSGGSIVIADVAETYLGTGGFVGELNIATCIDCYSTTDLTYTAGTITDAGGFVGDVSNVAAVCTRCWAVGDVLGGKSEADIGGFAGDDSASATFNDCFWDTTTSGQATSAGGATGKNTAEMQTQGTYTNYDFNTVWQIAASSYPTLQDVTVYSVDGFSVPDRDRKQLIVIGDNTVYVETPEGHDLNVVAGATLATASPLDAVEAFQKALIVNGTTKKVLDLKNKKITTAAIGANLPDRGNILVGGTSGSQMSVDYVHVTDFTGAPAGAATIYGKTLTPTIPFQAETVTGTNDAGDAISFTSGVEVDGPHFYDWTVMHGDTATYGVLPTNPTLCTLYRGRIVVTGDRDDPFNWWMLKQGNMFNMDINDDTDQTAVKGNSANAGLLGDIPRALITYKDDYLLFGCANSLWLMRGDPARGGSLDELEDVHGIYGRDSWCWDPEKNLYIFSLDGISMIPAGLGRPEPLTRFGLPKFIQDLNLKSDTHHVSMGFDSALHGLVITITNTLAKTNQNYWFDLRTRGFFPESYPDECSVTTQFYYKASDTEYRKTLIACMDGYIRWFDPAAKNDDIGATDEAIDSYVCLGPIDLSTPFAGGKISRLDFVSGGGGPGGSLTDSSNVSFKVWAELSGGKIMERFSANTNPRYAGTFKAPGRQRGGSKRQFASSNYAGIRVGNNTASQTWAFEKLIFNRKSGRRAQ